MVQRALATECAGARHCSVEMPVSLRHLK